MDHSVTANGLSRQQLRVKVALSNHCDYTEYLLGEKRSSFIIKALH